jgi:DNA-binding LacI/PurR family transcriptional regulator
VSAQITQTEIARLAGVTRLTVRRALGGQTGVGAQTADRIRQLAQQHGYLPNAAANATRTGRFNAIGLLIGSVTPRYLPAELVYGIEQSLADTGDQLLFSRLSDDRLRDDKTTPRMLQQLMVDGLLLHYTHQFPAELPARLSRHRLPSIWINTRLDHDCVYLDDEAAARSATRRLLELGHRRIAYVDRDATGHYSETDRRAGYEAQMRDAGLTPAIFALNYPTTRRPADTRFADARAWLDRPDPPTAVLAYSSTLMGPIATAALSMGRRLPEDLSLVGFDRYHLSPIGVPLTVIDTSMQQIATQAVDMLRRKIRRPAEDLAPAIVEPPMSDPCSLGPPVA